MRFIPLVFLMCVGIAQAQSLDLKSLNSLLKKRGAAWQAQDNKVSRLSRDERLRYLGAEHDDEVSFSLKNESKSSRLPAQWDWRNRDGVNYMSPVLDQGRCGSCVAFAVIGALETQLNVTKNTPFSPWSLSTQHLFSCGGGECEYGWTPSEAMSFLKSTGVPDESCFPYQSGAVGEDAACSLACKDVKERSIKITSSTAPTMFFANVEKVKQALMEGPLVGVMRVYEDFFFYKSGVYKHMAGEVQGGHAIMILGWNDADKSWIARNSWGKDWGEEGYFRIAWDDKSGVGDSTWKMVVPPNGSYVAVGGVEEKKAISGTLSLNLVSTFPNTKSITWNVLKKGKSVLQGRSFTDGPAQVETSILSDGVYELQAVAEHIDGKAYSHPKTIHILNGSIEGKLGFKNLTAGQTIKGTQVMEFEVASSPIAFDKVVFTRKNLATGEIAVKGTTNVASAMKMSWRTQNLTNGNYEISLKGIAGGQEVTSAPITVTVSN